MTTIPAGCYEIESTWEVVGTDLSFGESLSGQAQWVRGLAPRWRASLLYRVPHTTGAWLAWEAMLDELEGRLNPLDVTPAAIRLHESLTTSGVTFTGGVKFTGGVTFVSGPPTLTAFVKARSNRIDVGAPEALQIGKFVWIAGYMYRVTAKRGARITITPPLRFDTPAGTPLEATGTIAMIRQDASGGVKAMTAEGAGDATLDLVEYYR